MLEALKEAQKAKEIDEVPIGCVVVYQDKVISRAHNLKESMRMASAHAEVLALQKASVRLNGWRLTNCELYVTIEPCAMCAGFLYQARIKRVVFGAYDIKGGACGGSFDILSSTAINHKVEVLPNVLEANCSEVVTSYFSQKRNG